jgi:hypothetical protein
VYAVKFLRNLLRLGLKPTGPELTESEHVPPLDGVRVWTSGQNIYYEVRGDDRVDFHESHRLYLDLERTLKKDSRPYTSMSGRGTFAPAYVSWDVTRDIRQPGFTPDSLLAVVNLAALEFANQRGHLFNGSAAAPQLQAIGVKSGESRALDPDDTQPIPEEVIRRVLEAGKKQTQVVKPNGVVMRMPGNSPMLTVSFYGKGVPLTSVMNELVGHIKTLGIVSDNQLIPPYNGAHVWIIDCADFESRSRVVQAIQAWASTHKDHNNKPQAYATSAAGATVAIYPEKPPAPEII